MGVGFLIWIPFLFGGLFHACSVGGPRKPFQADPSFLSFQADTYWETLAQKLIGAVQDRHQRLQDSLFEASRALPAGSIDLPEIHDKELNTAATYGQLPVVIVDQSPSYVFPQPMRGPARYSWFQIAADSRDILQSLDDFGTGFVRWKAYPTPERISRFRELSGAWEAIGTQLIALARQARYLSTWIPQLKGQWQTSQKNGVVPSQYVLVRSLEAGPRLSPLIWDGLREALRPHRVVHRPFLPPQAKGLLRLPISTDVADRRFLSEVEGALATHWNQSPWAHEQGVHFKIRWQPIAVDQRFAAGELTLDEHLARFPKENAALTTGGLTTYVRGRALVLGPGLINPRTLAHELGHLLGFEDCYLRTLSSQGVLGVGVLEWDNPLYPDDLMCDNTVGVARAEAW